MVENKPDAVESALEKMTPFLTNVTFGGMMGYTTGYAMKKISKAVAFFVGVTFVALQTGVYCGYIDVDWLKIKDSAFQKVDADSDGKLTTNDLKHYWRKFKGIMKTKLPSAGGFSFGFVLGAKHG